MKKYLLIVLIITISIVGCAQSGNNNKSGDKPEMIFKKAEHNFGIIEYDGDGTHEFVFKNTSKLPLIITKVNSSCGCTTPEWSKEPVKPKKKGKIMVKFDTKRVGSFVKSVTVYSNAKNSPVRLVIRGEVKPKAEK